MKTEQITTVVSIVSVLGKVLDHYGLDKQAIAKQAGIKTDITYQPNDRLSTVMLQKVWKIAKQKSGDDCMGLTYAEFIQPASLCGLGLAWITSDSLKDSINRLIRFQHAISTALDFVFNGLDDCYQIILNSKINNPVDVSVDAGIATLFHMCRITYGPELVAERVCIAHSKPECSKKFNAFFGVDVGFGAAKNQIFFLKIPLKEHLRHQTPIWQG